MTEVMDTMFEGKQKEEMYVCTMYFNLCQNGNDILF